MRELFEICLKIQFYLTFRCFFRFGRGGGGGVNLVRKDVK